MSEAQSQVLGARSKAGEDAAALAQEAAGLEWRDQVRALVLIAESLPASKRAKQVELLKRALKVAQAQENSSSATTVELQAIRRLMPLDREAARTELEKVRDALEASLNEGGEVILEVRRATAWAWLYREFDPAAARLMVERYWARVSDQSQEYRWSGANFLALAMAPLVIERAQQLIERLPVSSLSGGNVPVFAAQRAVARWLLAEPHERASRPFSFWSQQDREDGRSPSEW